MTIQSIVGPILETIPVESNSREEIRSLYRQGVTFHTAQVFCVFLEDTPISRVAVFGSSAISNDDGLPRPLALIVNDESVHPLRVTAYVEAIVDTLGLGSMK